MITITRFAIHPTEPPLREVANWTRLPDDTTDPRAVVLAEQPGKWLLSTVREPLVDLASQHTPAVFNRFGDLVDVGGVLVGTQDLYALPLLDGYSFATEDEYVTAYNQSAGIADRIPEEV